MTDTAKKYICCYHNSKTTITATSAEEAAKKYVNGGDWVEHDHTIWITVHVAPVDDPEERKSFRIAVHPDEPACDSAKHDWTAIGGCVAHPGVTCNGLGAIIHYRCSICNVSHYADTWAHDPDTGEQGLYSVRYEVA